MNPATATKSKAATKQQPDAASQLADHEAQVAALEERQHELVDELNAKRRALYGPDFRANEGGLIQELEALYRSDRAEFASDGTPTGDEAKRLRAAIDEIGDLGPLTQEVEHARALAEKAQRDRDAFVRLHADELLGTLLAEAEQYPEAIRAAIDHLGSTVAAYFDFCGSIRRLLGAASRETRVRGEETAAALRRTVRGLAAPPTPTPNDEAVAADFATLENRTEEDA